MKIAHFGLFLPFLERKKILTLEINKNEVERARLVKEAKFPVFLCTAKFNFAKPHLLNFAEFEVIPNKVAWMTQASFKLCRFISMFVLSIE